MDNGNKVETISMLETQVINTNILYPDTIQLPLPKVEEEEKPLMFPFLTVLRSGD